MNLVPLQEPRFSKTHRPYTALEVCKLRGTVELKYPSDQMGKKLVSTQPSCYGLVVPSLAGEDGVQAGDWKEW